MRQLHRRSVPAYSEWGELELNYKVIARVESGEVIGGNLCYVACRDTAVHCLTTWTSP